MCAGSPFHRRAASMPEDAFAGQRLAMVAHQIEARGVRDPLILQAMRKVPRHLFVPEAQRFAAYEDYPLPLGLGQTISQPYIVAVMSECLGLRPGDRVLEIGTGSGYQAAVLAEAGAEVYSVEIIDALAKPVTQRLDQLGYRHVQVRVSDGYLGWPEQAPFDGILVTAGVGHIPAPLTAQLKVGGRMVIPVGPNHDTQWLKLLVRQRDGVLSEEDLMPVRFVPLTGERADGT